MSNDRLDPFIRTNVADLIRQMNEEELCFLHRLVVERLKLIHQARSTVMLANFSVGDRVSFSNTSGELQTGIITRLNKKSASILTDDRRRWTVHPVYLKKAAPEHTIVEAKSANSVRGG